MFSIKSRPVNSSILCLFVCFVLFVGFKNHRKFFSLWSRYHHYGWLASKFDLYLALMAIEQCGFLSVSRMLWHGTSVCNGQGPLTLTLVAEQLILVFANQFCCGWDLNTEPFEHNPFNTRQPLLPTAPPLFCSILRCIDLWSISVKGMFSLCIPKHIWIIIDICHAGYEINLCRFF